ALEGAENASMSFVFRDGAWTKTPHQKTAVNQPPRFQLYDHNGVPLDDEGVYPESTFEGSHIFAYKVDNDAMYNDPVLGFPVEYRNLGQALDIVFVHEPEVYRYTYVEGGVRQEIEGY